ncbi:MAG: peptidylprolyl isomerase, partial [Gammaproteobacteria bacterium]|nr:peptidylprolyl isomerase [Gammaproteobacteria bacterium]
MSGPVIAANSRVRVHLALALADGSEVLSTFGEEPL